MNSSFLSHRLFLHEARPTTVWRPPQTSSKGTLSHLGGRDDPQAHEFSASPKAGHASGEGAGEAHRLASFRLCPLGALTGRVEFVWFMTPGTASCPKAWPLLRPRDLPL